MFIIRSHAQLVTRGQGAITNSCDEITAPHLLKTNYYAS
jgi:hypothetical protein